MDRVKFNRINRKLKAMVDRYARTGKTEPVIHKRNRKR